MQNNNNNKETTTVDRQLVKVDNNTKSETNALISDEKVAEEDHEQYCWGTGSGWCLAEPLTEPYFVNHHPMLECEQFDEMAVRLQYELCGTVVQRAVDDPSILKLLPRVEQHMNESLKLQNPHVEWYPVGIVRVLHVTRQHVAGHNNIRLQLLCVKKQRQQLLYEEEDEQQITQLSIAHAEEKEKCRWVILPCPIYAFNIWKILNYQTDPLKADLKEISAFAHVKGGHLALRDGNYIPRVGLHCPPDWTSQNAEQMVHDALDIGYRLFDLTIFQNNRREISSAIKKFLPWFGLTRADICVSVKINILRPGTANRLLRPGPGPISHQQSIPAFNSVADYIEHCVQRCCEEFEGYIDVCLLHYPKEFNVADDDNENSTDRLEAYRVLAKHRAKNSSVRSIGVANFEPAHIEELLSAGLPCPVVNQSEMHLFFQRSELLHFCETKNIILQAHSIFSYRKEQFSPEIYREMDRIAEQFCLNKSQLNVAFLLNRSERVGIVPMVRPCLLGNTEQLWAQRRSALKQLLACSNVSNNMLYECTWKKLKAFDMARSFTKCRQWNVR